MTAERRQQTDASTAQFNGRTCVVTGASRGIGREIALALGRAGADVVVNYRSAQGAASDVADDIDSGAGEALCVEADVTDPAAVESLAAETREAFGSIDVLVNNAGITRDCQFAEMSREEWDQVLDVNLGGAFNCTKAFYDDIRDSAEGRLVNVGSVIGQRGNYGQANYAASKSALFGFTRSLARELAPHGSTANCVSPGYTRTQMVEAVREKIQDSIREDIPLNRFAEAEEVAAAVEFLASERASYITGEILNVNGGMHV